MPAYPLSQASVITSHPASDGLRQMIEETHPITDFISFVPVPEGNAQRRWFEESSLPSVSFRGIYGSYTPDYGRIVPKSDPVVILGGEFEVDIAMRRLYGNDLPDYESRQLQMLARSAMMTFGHQLIEGDAGINPNSFDGLRVRAAERNMEFPMAAGDVGELTLEKLDEVFDAVLGSKVVHLNQWLKRKINALVRASGQAREVVSGSFGRQYDTYADVPLFVQERRDDMSTILGFDEDPGDGGDDAASIYVVHYGGPEEDQAVMALLGAGGAFDAYALGEDHNAPVKLWRLEVYIGLSAQGNRPLARISNIGQI